MKLGDIVLTISSGVNLVENSKVMVKELKMVMLKKDCFRTTNLDRLDKLRLSDHGV